MFWATRGFPVDNDGSDDTSGDVEGITVPNGSVFRVVEYAPGRPPRNHRTDSIDYAVVMSGEIDMEMDGAMVHLKAGDVLVQRGTIHNWINNGTEPCVIAFALIDAKTRRRRQDAECAIWAPRCSGVKPRVSSRRRRELASQHKAPRQDGPSCLARFSPRLGTRRGESSTLRIMRLGRLVPGLGVRQRHPCSANCRARPLGRRRPPCFA